jgi:small conductance mechanosensitive channel
MTLTPVLGLSPVTVEHVELEELKTYYDIAWPFVSSILMGIVIFVVGWIASRWAHKLTLNAARRAKVDEALVRFFASIARYSVLAATVIAALGEVGIQTTSLVAVFASAGLAVGLALQGSLANFASGVLILFFRPINLGDVVSVAGEAGKVTDIGLFTTTLTTLDNHKIIVPNASVTGGNITNYSVLGRRRAQISIGVAYGVDLEKAMKALQAAADRAELVLKDPAPAVAFVGFGASSLDFLVLPWAEPDDFIPMTHNVRKAIYEELEKADIEIPFNQIVVHQAAA